MTVNILQIDQNILQSINGFFIGRNTALDAIFKFLAAYLIYALPVILLLIWFLVKSRQKEMVLAMGSLLLAWLVLIKLILFNIWYRPRLNIALLGGKELLFHRPDNSFPSDHAAVLFAITFTFYLLGWKKAANWFLIYSVAIVASRVVVGVHYPLDVIAGAAVGLIAALIITSFKAPLTKYITTPIINGLKYIHLA